MAAAGCLHDGSSRLRLELQARLLAGQSPHEIAPRFQATPEAVAAYEALFFAVGDRLGARDYITFAAIDPGGLLVTGTPTTEVLIKLLAYHGGPLVAELVLAVLRDETAGES